MPNPEQVVLDMDQNAAPPASGLSIKSPRSPDHCVGPKTPTASTAAAKQPQPATQGRPVLTRLPYSKPKSRFVELNHPLPNSRPAPIPEQNSPPDSDEEEDEEEDEVAEQAIQEKYLATHRRRRRIRWRPLVEWSAFVLLTAFLAAGLSLPHLQARPLWSIPLWKWTLMLLVALSGRLVSGWLVSVLAFLIERRFLLEEKVLYFVYGLRRSVQNCLWLGLVLLAWTLLINPAVDDESSNHNRRVLRFMSRALIAVLISAVIWLVKIFLVKVLASSFHVATFFDRMKESVFHHYILEALSGPPRGEDAASDADADAEDEYPPPPKGKKGGRKLAESKSLPARLGVVGGSGRRLDMERLRRLSRTRATACGVRRLMGHVMSRGLSSSISRTAEELARGGAESDITSEWEARCAAERIFKNVAKPGYKYIEEEDLHQFLRKVEVHTIFPLFEGALETGKIKKSAFRNWVVRAYLERKSLAHSLNDTKTAVQQLHKLASAVVSIVIIVVALLVMGVATTKVFVLVTSQLLLVGFMFQNTCKTIFESIIFVFVMHPFDVGDRCVIDGVQMIVEEMNILTTVFLRFDNEKIYYPNSVLLTKPISNFYRSPDMGDSIEFAIDVSTPLENITAMNKSIQMYIESKPKHWNAKHSVVVKEIENVNRMKIALFVLHTMNHQNFGEKNNRRSELLLELKRIFESLNIKYHLLPQEVHLTQVVMASGRVPMPLEVEGR